MRTSRRLIPIALASVLVGGAACSSDTDLTAASTSVATTSTVVATTAVATTTTVAPTTTTAPATTTSSTTTTTTMPATTTLPPTTTTLPPGASLPLRFDGVGDARFGTEPDDVVAYVTAALGPPTEDSGWVDAPSRTCPGTEVRFVSWADLLLLFGDDTGISSGRRHFFVWDFGPPDGEAAAPAGMATALGISIGSTVVDIRAAYPAAEIFEGDDIVSAGASLEPDLFAFLTDATDTGAVIALRGGGGCGE